MIANITEHETILNLVSGTQLHLTKSEMQELRDYFYYEQEVVKESMRVTQEELDNERCLEEGYDGTGTY